MDELALGDGVVFDDDVDDGDVLWDEGGEVENGAGDVAASEIVTRVTRAAEAAEEERGTKNAERSLSGSAQDSERLPDYNSNVDVAAEQRKLQHMFHRRERRLQREEKLRQQARAAEAEGSDPEADEAPMTIAFADPDEVLGTTTNADDIHEDVAWEEIPSTQHGNHDDGTPLTQLMSSDAIEIERETKKGPPRDRTANKEDRAIAKDAHRVSLMFLLESVRRFDVITNDEWIQSLVLSRLAHVQTDHASPAQLLQFFLSSFVVDFGAVRHPQLKPLPQRNEVFPHALSEAIRVGRCSTIQAPLLFAALARASGFRARVVVIVDPVPLRPRAKEIARDLYEFSETVRNGIESASSDRQRAEAIQFLSEIEEIIRWWSPSFDASKEGSKVYSTRRTALAPLVALTTDFDRYWIQSKGMEEACWSSHRRSGSNEVDTVASESNNSKEKGRVSSTRKSRETKNSMRRGSRLRDSAKPAVDPTEEELRQVRAKSSASATTGTNAGRKKSRQARGGSASVNEEGESSDGKTHLRRRGRSKSIEAASARETQVKRSDGTIRTRASTGKRNTRTVIKDEKPATPSQKRGRTRQSRSQTAAVRESSDSSDDVVEVVNIRSDDDDSDIDFSPKTPTPKRKQAQKRRSEAISSARPSPSPLKSSPKRSRSANHIWSPLFVEIECNGSYTTVDVANGVVNAPERMYRTGQPILYAIACRGGKMSDVTDRYNASLQKHVKDRLPSKEIDELLRIWSSGHKLGKEELLIEESDREKIEEKTKEDADVFPSSLAEYNNHPQYALEVHLKKYECIYPMAPDKVLGTFKGHDIYPRDCVYLLHTKDRWLRICRKVRDGEYPAKLVKAHSWSPSSVRKGGTGFLEVYGIWQTDAWKPPPAKNGRVPKNERGNVDLWSPDHLPEGTVHVNHRAAHRVAAKLRIDYAPAMTGFDVRKGRSIPCIEGVVVCKEFEDAIRDGCRELDVEKRKKESEKRRKQVQSLWRKYYKGVLARDRLNRKYANSGSNSQRSAEKSPSTSVQTPRKRRRRNTIDGDNEDRVGETAVSEQQKSGTKDAKTRKTTKRHKQAHHSMNLLKKQSRRSAGMNAAQKIRSLLSVENDAEDFASAPRRSRRR